MVVLSHAHYAHHPPKCGGDSMRKSTWHPVQSDSPFCTIYIRAELMLLPIDGKAIRFDRCRRGYELVAYWLEVPLEVVKNSYWSDLEGQLDEELIGPFLNFMTQRGDDIDELEKKIQFIALTLINDLMRDLLRPS